MRMRICLGLRSLGSNPWDLLERIGRSGPDDLKRDLGNTTAYSERKPTHTMGDAERQALMALWQAGKKQWGNDHSAFRVDLQGIHRVVHFITENLLEEEELFTSIESSVEYSKNNDAIVYSKLVEAIKSDEKAVLNRLMPQADPYTVAAALKGYFQDMPEPIIQHSQYDRYIEIAEEARGLPDSVKAKRLSKALSELPKPRYANLHSIAKLCMSLDDSIGDLAVVFGPSILRPRKNSGGGPDVGTVEGTKLIINIVLMIFNMHEQLFVKGGGGKANTWKPTKKKMQQHQQQHHTARGGAIVPPPTRKKNSANGAFRRAQKLHKPFKSTTASSAKSSGKPQKITNMKGKGRSIWQKSMAAAAAASTKQQQQQHSQKVRTTRNTNLFMGKAKGEGICECPM
eukprot:jgi/Bigna1/74420/fgenesh1_pg.29_\